MRKSKVPDRDNRQRLKLQKRNYCKSIISQDPWGNVQFELLSLDKNTRHGRCLIKKLMFDNDSREKRIYDFQLVN